MKNKGKLIIFALLLFAVGSVGASVAKAAQTPEQAVKSFYAWYLKEISSERGGDAFGRNKTVLAKYVSKRLIKSIKAQMDAQEYDVDYFINAQDFDEKWQAATTRAVVKGNTATLKVTLAAPKAKKADWTQRLSLKLIKEGGAWKIDGVK